MKNFILYGVATGFNRASAFIIIPLLSPLLTVDDFGSFTLYMIAVQFFVPFLSLNISSIIAREAIENWRTTLNFVIAFNKLSGLFVLLLSIVILIKANIIFLAVFYAMLEAIFLVNTTLIRFKSKVEYFFIFSLMKLILLALLLGIAWVLSFRLLEDINYLILIFALSNIVIIFPYSKITFKFNFGLHGIIKYLQKNKGMLFFALSLLPHIVAQWVISGSDRFIINLFSNNDELGIYSFAYSVAAIFMLINSALALGMPQYCVNHYEYYSTKAFYKKYFIVISVLWLLFVGAILSVFPYFPEKYSYEKALPVFLLVALGMYFLSFYYYFSSIIFYERKAKELSLITIKVAVINVIVAFLLTLWLGILGTALSTTISYFIYTFMAFSWVKKHRSVNNLAFPAIFALLVSVVIIVYMWLKFN